MNAQTLAALGKAQHEKGNWQEASEHYRQASALAPRNAALRHNLGVCLALSGRWDQAARAFEHAAIIAPGHAEAHLALAICLLNGGRFAETAEACQRCLRESPDCDEALLCEAIALRMLDRFSEAEQACRACLQRRPGAAEVWSELVLLGMTSANEPLLREAGERLLELRPGCIEALEGLATAAFLRQDWDEAARCSRLLAEERPEGWQRWHNLAVAEHNSGNLPQASEAYGQALRQNPGSASTANNYAALLAQWGRMREARAHLEHACNGAVDCRAPLWNLALILEFSGDGAAAESAFRRLLESFPADADASFRLGSLQAARGDNEAASASFQTCVRVRHDWADAWINLGVCLSACGRSQPARDAFERALEVEPMAPEALRWLMAEALGRKDLDTATRYERQLLAQDACLPELTYNLGVLAHELCDYSSAARHYRRALEYQPNMAESLLNLGHVMRAMGMGEEAKECWRQALAVKPELTRA
jgi:Flp pilus assembly protein TadD